MAASCRFFDLSGDEKLTRSRESQSRVARILCLPKPHYLKRRLALLQALALTRQLALKLASV
jgi:hypothetical protein